VKNQLSFFATADDLSSLLKAVESAQPLQFTMTGMFDTSEVMQRESIAGLGCATSGDANHEPAYLVSARGVPIEVRPVPQRSGGVKYAVDQIANPMTIAFRPGGVFDDTCLIAGQVGTVSRDPASLTLFRLFVAKVGDQFTRIKTFYVGEYAERLLDKGYRLTANAKSPALYDLRRD
jgi:hypothetical protein